MNDFTKDELLRLFEWGMNIAEAYPEQLDDLDKILCNKIDDMYVDYCDHEWVNGTYCEKCDKTPTGGK